MRIIVFCTLLLSCSLSVPAQDTDKTHDVYELCVETHSEADQAVNFEYVKKSILVPVCLRGARGIQTVTSFILDTGTNTTIIDKQLARTLDLPTLGANNLIAPGGVNSNSRRVELQSIRAAGREMTKIPVVTQNMSSYSRAHRRVIGGLLGSDFLRGLVVVIDYPNQNFSLLRGFSRMKGVKQILTAL